MTKIHGGSIVKKLSYTIQVIQPYERCYCKLLIRVATNVQSSRWTIYIRLTYTYKIQRCFDLNRSAMFDIECARISRYTLNRRMGKLEETFYVVCCSYICCSYYVQFRDAITKIGICFEICIICIRYCTNVCFISTARVYYNKQLSESEIFVLLLLGID